jgi:hypothetical protein
MEEILEIPNVMNRLLQPLLFIGRKHNHSGNSSAENSTPPNQDGKSHEVKNTVDNEKQETARPEQTNQSGHDGKRKDLNQQAQTRPSQPEQGRANSNQQPVSREYTRQIVAEAGIENLPEDQFPDVLLDIPTVKVDEIKIEVDDLDAEVALRADLANLLKLNIGAHVSIKKVEIDILGVEAQATQFFHERLKR